MSALYSVCVCVCVSTSVSACACVCLRKKDVSDPCGPVYLHPYVGVEGGQRQGCLYPSPFPRLLSHRHSGHKRMKRLWIFSPPPYTCQSRKIRQKMSTAWPIQSSFKPNIGGIWPELSGSWSTSARKTLMHTHRNAHTHTHTHTHMHAQNQLRQDFTVQGLVMQCLGVKYWPYDFCFLTHSSTHTHTRTHIKHWRK